MVSRPPSVVERTFWFEDAVVRLLPVHVADRAKSPSNELLSRESMASGIAQRLKGETLSLQKFVVNMMFN